MFRRARAPSDPVLVRFDGAELRAQRGEPLVVTLLASGAGALARSPKLHRPRGPSCMRGGCDGCLARVDGVPNVMTCLHPVTGEHEVSTQNVLGTRDLDLLQVTDWFFPDGLDHHHLLAGAPGLGSIMQSFARKVAGLGRLPDAAVAPRPAARATPDALVVGAGPSGLAAASTLAAAGLSTWLVDERARVGGSFVGLPTELAELTSHPRADVSRHLGRHLELRLETVAGGVFEGEVLLEGRDGAVRVRPGVLLLATGAHDPVLAVPNNDLPGVLSARALLELAAHGLEPVGPVVVVGSGPWAERVVARFEGATRVDEDELVSIRGRSRVRGVEVRGPKGRVAKLPAGVVAVATRAAPSFELASQALDQNEQTPSVELVRDPRGGGFAPRHEGDGRVAEGLYVAGELAGAEPELAPLVASGVVAAEAALRERTRAPVTPR